MVNRHSTDLQDFLDWKRRLLQRHGLDRPDARPLYRYRLTMSEFSTLESLLRTSLKGPSMTHHLDAVASQRPGFACLFVLYAAEWWQRQYESGHWSWEPILKRIGANPDEWSRAQRSECVTRGLRDWGLKPRADGGLRYLGSVAVQGGLPLRLLAEARGGIGQVLGRVVQLARGSRATQPELLAWVDSLQGLLPRTYRQAAIFALLAEVVWSILDLKEQARLTSGSNAVRQLDEAIPDWRERFPLPVDDAQVRGLIEQLVRAVAVVREVWRINGEVRAQEPGGEIYRIRTGQAGAGGDLLLWQGERCWLDFRSPSIAFKGRPQLVEITKDNVKQPVNGTPQFSGCVGPVTSRYPANGPSRHRGRLLLLPPNAKLALDCRDARSGTIRLEGWQASKADVLTAGVEKMLSRNGGALNLDLVLRSDARTLYLKSERAVKYGVLFVVLTFAAFFLTETLRRLAMHPLQYLLVGLALATFFLLLIGLSEHLDFAPAYASAAVASTLLITVYLASALRERRRGIAFGTGIALLYAVLYGVLLSENNALLMGSLLIFAALAATMLTTRHIDWYRVGNGDEPAASAGESA